MWEVIKNFVLNIHESVNGYLAETLNLDGLFIGLYDQYVQPIPELFKILGTAFLVIIILLGTISFVKKMLKLFIVIAVIMAIVFFASQYA